MAAAAAGTAATAMEASAVEATKTSLSAGGIASRHPAVIEPAEGAGMRTRHRAGIVKTATPFNAAATKSTAIEAIAINDCPAMREVCVVVVHYSSAMAPIESPIVPAPAETTKESNPEAQSEPN